MSNDDDKKPATKRRMPEGRRFQKGQSANPGGRPKGFTHRVHEFMAEASAPKKGGEPRRRIDQLLEAIFATAVDRSHRDHMKAAELLCAYEGGRPRERVEMSGPGGAPIETLDRSARLERMTTGELRKRLAKLEAAKQQRLSAKPSDETPPAAT